MSLLLLGTTATADAAEPSSLSDVLRRLHAARDELRVRVAQARQDPRIRQLAVYRSYASQHDAGVRTVKAEDVVAWLQDPALPAALRSQALDALIRAARERRDPDLRDDLRRGRGTNQGAFFRRHVVPLLKAKHRETRRCARSLLVRLYGAHFGYAVDDKGTWTDAFNAWRKYLRKK